MKSKGGDILQTNDFEKAYGDFIDGREYDAAQDTLFLMVRISFAAGWQAAGGEPPAPRRAFKTAPKNNPQG